MLPDEQSVHNQRCEIQLKCKVTINATYKDVNGSPSEGGTKMRGNSSPSEGGHGEMEGETRLQAVLVTVVLLLTFGRWDENAGKQLTFGRWAW